jgi:hypothetical protein
MNSLVTKGRAILNTPTLIALVALKGYSESKRGKKLYIEDLSNYLIDLKSAGIDISRISLSISAGKYWSEDVAQFVSEGIVFGDIRHNSPIEFTDKCVTVCRQAIEEYSKEYSEIQSIVGKASEILEIQSPLV